MTAPKERPIIFSGPMVNAILAGSKTMTRRVMKPQPSEGWEPHSYGDVHKMLDGEFLFRNEEPVLGGWGPSSEDGMEAHPCPFGQPGDRLWVREAWRIYAWKDDDGDLDILYEADGEVRQFLPSEAELSDERLERYRAQSEQDLEGGRVLTRLRPSIHMPRWASRLTLEVVSVRVERLQDITVNDVVAEGIDLEDEHADDFLNAEHAQAGGLSIPCDHPEIYPFVRLWDSINGRKPGSAWKDDPWVWCIAFKQVTP